MRINNLKYLKSLKNNDFINCYNNIGKSKEYKFIPKTFIA